MIEVIYGGNKYRYCKSDRGSYWIGIQRGNKKGDLYSGDNCIVAMGHWPELRKAAIESGTAPEDFITKKAESKAKKARKKKSKGPSISIF